MLLILHSQELCIRTSASRPRCRAASNFCSVGMVVPSLIRSLSLSWLFCFDDFFEKKVKLALTRFTRSKWPIYKVIYKKSCPGVPTLNSLVHDATNIWHQNATWRTCVPWRERRCHASCHQLHRLQHHSLPCSSFLLDCTSSLSSNFVAGIKCLC
jgi:hypothetical protein